MDDSAPIPSFCLDHSLFPSLVDQRFAQLAGFHTLPSAITKLGLFKQAMRDASGTIISLKSKVKEGTADDKLCAIMRLLRALECRNWRK
eukprot:5414574-Heterocapsa_arctica.AAC.1